MPLSPTLILSKHNDWPQWLVRPFRNLGKPIPRFVWASGEQDPPIGYLSIDWAVSDTHRRGMKVARFWAIDAKEDLLPCLRDVGLVRLATNDLTITGFERIGDREYA